MLRSLSWPRVFAFWLTVWLLASDRTAQAQTKVERDNELLFPYRISPSRPVAVAAIQKLLDEVIIETTSLQQERPLREVLKILQEKVRAQGKDVGFLVDVPSFVHEDPEAPKVLDVPIRFPLYPRRLTLATAVRLTLSRIPTGNATYRVRRGYLEITTHERMSQILDLIVEEKFVKRPLREVLDQLAESTGVSIVLDRRVSKQAVLL